MHVRPTIKIFVFLFGLLIGGELFGQQDAKYTQYMFNTLMYNPAYAGTKDAISATAIHREQWVAFEGAPRTSSIHIHGPLREKYGLGLALQYDQWGVHDWLEVQGSYSYKFYVSPKSKVSVGLSASALNQVSNYKEVGVVETDDRVFANDESNWLANFGFGIFYYSNKHYLGFSIPKLLTNDYLSALTSDGRQFRHFYVAGGLVLPLNESGSLKLKPAALLKSVGSFAPVQLDIDLQLFINDAFWVGGSYRTNDSFDFLAGFYIGRSLRLGYAFDVINTDIQDHSHGTHEVMVGFDINTISQKIITPRHF